MPTSDNSGGATSAPVTGNLPRSLSPLIDLVFDAARPTSSVGTVTSDDSTMVLLLQTGTASAAAFGTSTAGFGETSSSGLAFNTLGVPYRTTDQAWSQNTLSMHGAPVSGEAVSDNDAAPMPADQNPDAPPPAPADAPGATLDSGEEADASDADASAD
jgi:hypothetical protein